MSLKEVLDENMLSRNLRIKVISKQSENFIIGDKSGLAIFLAPNDAFKNMEEGKCYAILKPTKIDDHTVTANEKYRPITIDPFSFEPRKTDLNKLRTLLKSTEDNQIIETKNRKIESFEDLKKLEPNIEIKAINAKIISISRDISGQYGTYNIAQLKDLSSAKMDLNIYKRQLKMQLKVGEIFELQNLKITQYTKDSKLIKRLATSPRSTCKKPSNDIIVLFENVSLGDKREKAKVVAVEDIFPYTSCSKCWKKTHEDDLICKCGNTDTIHVNDFHAKFYIEELNEKNIEVLHIFRRQTKIVVNSIQQEEIRSALEKSYLGKIFNFDYNIDTDKDELIMVEINDINK